MGLTRTALFNEKQNELAKVAKALAHPARIAIIERLLETEHCINSDLVDELGLAQATISQHLRELKDSGLIQGTIEGVRMSYCINPTKWKALQYELSQFFDRYPADQLPNCC